MALHSGEIVELAIRRKGISISELSRRMHVNRRSIYNWFQQKTLRIETICEIGYIIGYDFSNEFPKEFAPHGFAIMEDLLQSGRRNGEEGTNSVHFWMAKYISLLEKYNELLQSKERQVENEELFLMDDRIAG